MCSVEAVVVAEIIRSLLGFPLQTKLELFLCSFISTVVLLCMFG